MEQFKRAQVIMLPTKNRPCLLNLTLSNKLHLWNTNGTTYNPNGQHLYIVSDDEIKENNFILTFTHTYGYKVDQVKEILKGTYVSVRNELLPEELIKGKIIATTNTSLNKKHNCDCGATTYEGCSQCLEILPKLSQQFITKYIESYNKGEVITNVLVEYESIKTTELDANSREMWDFVNKLKINPKDNTITIKKLKDNWNREEVKKLINESYLIGLHNGNEDKEPIDHDEWVNKIL